MKLGYVLLYVVDVEATVEFYSAAFGLKQRFLTVEGKNAYAELETGETRLGFASKHLAESNGVQFRMTTPEGDAPGFEVALVTEDVEGAYDHAIKANATPVAGPKKKPWGQTVAYVRDLNGFLIEICSPMP